MRITGTIPPHIARAYGVPPGPRPTPLAPTPPVSAPTPADPAAEHRTSANIQRLVAGHAPGGVDFASASTPSSPAGPYQLYTRAADKVEAAIAVQVGRTIDVKG